MPWNIHLSPDRRFIVIRYHGVVTPEDLLGALAAAVTLSSSEQVETFFTDCSEMATGGHTIVDLYMLIQDYERNGIRRTMKQAVLLPFLPDAVPAVQFYETASFNNGYNVRLFQKREDALAWLCSPALLR
jgi:hypothetical protein